VVSRQVLIDSRFVSVICAPVYSAFEGLSTQVPVGIPEGLKHESGLYCDELVSLPKTMLTHFVGMLAPDKLRLLDRALLVALQIQAE
jgi:mRNA interferase MazF